jgi:hypothetical protein
VQTVLESFVQKNRPAGDLRTRAQQLGDALVQWADLTLAAGSAPVLRTHKPQVVVTIPLEDLVGADTAPGAARMGFGAQISAARARWLACDGEITRVVIGPESQPLDLGRPATPQGPAASLRAVGGGVVLLLRRLLGAEPLVRRPPRPRRGTPTTGPPRWTTAGCSANATTPRSTTASASNEIPTADGTPTAPTALRS